MHDKKGCVVRYLISCAPPPPLLLVHFLMIIKAHLCQSTDLLKGLNMKLSTHLYCTLKPLQLCFCDDLM